MEGTCVGLRSSEYCSLYVLCQRLKAGMRRMPRIIKKRDFSRIMREFFGGEIPSSLVDELYAACDENQDGKVSREELMQFLATLVYASMEERFKEMVALVDSDGDGRLSRAELRTVFKVGALSERGLSGP